MTAQQVAQALVDAAQAGNLRLLVALSLVFVVLIVRGVAPKIHGPFGAWLNSTRPSAVLALLGGIAGAIASSAIAQHAVTLGTVVTGVTVGVTAIGGWNAFWDLFSPNDKPKPSSLPLPPVAALLTFALALSIAGCPASCPAPTPTPITDGGATPSPGDLYLTDFAACLKTQGISDATGVGLDAWKIINSGASQQTIVKELENLGIKAGGIVGTLLVSCAVQAWLNTHPVGSDVTPTTAHGGARVYLIRHPVGPPGR